MTPKRAVEEILEKVNIMPLEDQCIIIEILKNRYREKRREEILKHLEETMEEYKKGLTSKGSVADLLKELESD
ncbi:MAG TPA: hypothetical protein EYP21_10595 [Syntrophaceae bacterium]|nr:hypothetical protein [Syntrophaceae bacterium]